MKSILVHLDASPRAAERLALARGLAKRHGAELTAVYGVLSSMLATPWLDGGAASVSALMAELDRSQRERARALFDRVLGDLGARWVEASGEGIAWSVARSALTSDLVVLGQPDPEDRQTGALPPDLVTSVVIDSGKPSLLVPYAGSFDPAPREVLLAWKPTREAARAASAALPWLQAASRVHVVAQGTPELPQPFEPLEHWLRLEGVAAPLMRHTLAPIEAGEALLSLAAELDVGLLVMGCYGHSRAREWVLGGASRTILQSMTLPVLMVH